MSWSDFLSRTLGTQAAAPQPAPSPLSRRQVALAAPVALLAVAGGGKAMAETASPGGPPPVPVTVVTLRAEPVKLTTELPGRVAAFRTAEVRPQVGGIIRDRLFTEGESVAAGQPLYQIDPASYEASLQSAEASLARAEATAASARTTVNRYRPLVAARAVSQQDFDTATASLRQAEADVASARAAVTSARLNLGYTRITAPIAGRVGRSSVTAGALVTADQATSLATVIQLDPIYVDVVQASASQLRLRREMEAGRLTPAEGGGAQLRLILPDGSTYDRPGQLQFTEVVVDQGTGSVVQRAIFPNPDGILLPGMFVRAQLEEGVSPGAVLVPQQAISRTPRGEATVTVATPAGELQPRRVQAERTVGNRWLVTAGLSAGDRVVVEGAWLRPGVRPQITEITLEELDRRAATPRQARG
ncbi:efflux RND transporter periplasmic adaptor subunit [Falsiroseomonas ponticola]|uniref:efflux RND transporter periplasmic adaptor subunit n=1 Tax=Falsiroseomonas ponticola TaxID=2786951 RepID=UPI001932D5F9|nr:efflux RND transporter periplasmic adaptor subunit [Roseomonas ponticola]